MIYIQTIQDYVLPKHVLLGDLYMLQNIHTWLNVTTPNVELNL